MTGIATGGDIEAMYKAALIGAGLKAFVGAEKLGVKLFKNTILSNAIVKRGAYLILNSAGKNWLGGDPVFSKFTADIALLRVTFDSKTREWFSWQNNIEKFTESTFKLIDDLLQGDAKSNFSFYYLTPFFYFGSDLVE